MTLPDPRVVCQEHVASARSKRRRSHGEFKQVIRTTSSNRINTDALERCIDNSSSHCLGILVVVRGVSNPEREPENSWIGTPREVVVCEMQRLLSSLRVISTASCSLSSQPLSRLFDGRRKVEALDNVLVANITVHHDCESQLNVRVPLYNSLSNVRDFARDESEFVSHAAGCVQHDRNINPSDMRSARIF